MASNALLGSRISLISKKNIRYEGTLYSINESDATVALQDVKSFGTEGRELLDTTGASTFVPPNDVVHAYLLFRGQDIKDLHVHEKQPEGVGQQAAQADEKEQVPPEESAPEEEAAPEGEAAPESELEEPTPPAQASSPAAAPPEPKQPAERDAKAKEGKRSPGKPQAREQKKQQPEKTRPAASKNEATRSKNQDNASGDSKENKPTTQQQQQQKKGGGSNRNKSNKNNLVGTGASLLNRKARGAKGDQAPKVEGEFDFESNLAVFDKADFTAEAEEDENGPYDNDEEEDDAGDPNSMDDFFDVISSDAMDRANGIDNRLRGAAERSLNLDTFGATSLNHGPRRGGNL